MQLSKKTDAEILAVAVPIMDNLMEASTAIDRERHVRDFTERAKAYITAERLRQICEICQAEKGYFGPRALIGILRRPNSVVVLWNQAFTKAPGEYLAELVLVEQQGRNLVDHVMVV